MNPELSSYRPSGSQVRPWLRWAARLFDLYLFTILAVILISIISPETLNILNDPSLKSSEAKVVDLITNLLTMSIYAFVEAAMLCKWGTTPGKALLKIRLRRQDGTKLSYSQALTRSFSVSFRGLAFGIQGASLLTNLYSYNRLTKDGITVWDRQGNFSVSHQVIGFFRGTAFILFFVTCFVLAAIGSLPD